MSGLRVVLAEDDHMQVGSMIKSMRQSFGGDQVNVDVVKTELEFRSRLEEMQRNPPDIFIIDVLLHWTSPQPGMNTAPIELTGGGPDTPGFRCQELLAASDATRNVPVLLYSAYHTSNWESKVRTLPPTVIYLSKDDQDAIIDAIRKLTGHA